MATMVRSDIYCCLRAQTIGKNKKIKETKDPSQNHSKTIENNKKKQKKTKISATRRLVHGFDLLSRNF